MARLNIPAWDIPGRCDIRAMTYVINAYLRRHDTYRSWFEYTDDDHDRPADPANPQDIKFVANRARRDVGGRVARATSWPLPSPLQWDCFRFGIIQREDHFTFYISVDHVHIDAMFMGLAFVEIHMMYAALVSDGRRSGSRRRAAMTITASGSTSSHPR